jgi:hypothetical protein
MVIFSGSYFASQNLHNVLLDRILGVLRSDSLKLLVSSFNGSYWTYPQQILKGHGEHR